MQSLDPNRWGGKAMPGQDDLPCDDGEPVETDFHDAQPALLKDTLIDAWADRHDFFIGGNMFVYFSERQLRSNDFRGPDVFVALDIEQKERKSWVAWEEGGRLPDVVIEVTSPSTAHVDRGEKMRIYSQIWHTGAYFIFDPETEQLEAYRLDHTGRRYETIAPDERGDYEVAALGLKLGLRETKFRFQQRRFLRWIAADGSALPLATERAHIERQRAEAEHQRAEAERQRAEAERQRADALEAELRALRTK
ncbi:MAG TPA: Uma2 family endonuclease [Polyangiaceae bacterium]|nr:Uma2 family endonuclease [Polyangiaceae bacterium]